MAGDLGSYAYGAFAHNEDELARLEKQASIFQEMEKQMLLASGLAGHMRVLDLACGPGNITRLIAGLLTTGTVVGADANPALLARAAAETTGDEAQKITYVQADAHQLAFPADAFDFVYERFLFQHVSRPAAILTAIKRVLAPGGILLVVDVDDDWSSLHPEPAHFKTFLALAAEGQAARGGDRRVGRKLVGYDAVRALGRPEKSIGMGGQPAPFLVKQRQ